MEVTFQQVREKEVVSTETGARLGRVCDLTFNFTTGCVLGIVLPGKGFFSKEDLFIPLSGIEKIGEDVILVRLTPFNQDPKGGKNVKPRPCAPPPPRPPQGSGNLPFSPQGNGNLPFPPQGNKTASFSEQPHLSFAAPTQRQAATPFADRSFDEE